MYSAQATTDSNGNHNMISTNIGTGGHGDTNKTYTETFSTKPSLVTKTIKYNTGKKCADGKVVYYTHKYKELRVNTLRDCNEISPLIASEFKKIGLVDWDKMKCLDLMRWTKNKDNEDIETKRGLSFVYGDYEARLINGRHVFLYKTKIVRSFARKWMND